MAGPETIEFLVRENATLRARVDELEEDLQLRAGSSADQNRPETILGLNVMILYVSPNRQVGYMNSAMANLFGYPRETLLGRPLEELDHFRWGPGLLQMLWDRATAQNRAHEVEAKYYDDTLGAMRYVVIRATPSDGGVQYVIEDRTHYRHLQSIFSRYVSPRVIEQMLATGRDYFKAEHVNLTILFSDLRGFTAASRALSPEAVKAMIDTHLGALVDVLVAEDGTIDKIMGDGIMAFFGAPVRLPDHPVRALNAALKMQQAHAQVMARWQEEGLPVLPMGIGINTGEVVAGNVGCEKRMEYTVIGHPVNLASRLCQTAGGGDIILSTNTFQAVRRLLTSGQARLDFPVKFRNGFRVTVKGLDEPVPTVVATRIE